MKLPQWKRERRSKLILMLKRKSKILVKIEYFIKAGSIEVARLSNEKREINKLINQ